ncbi:FAD-dependent oxidoreductase [Gordonia sp. PKS22-38]|uniref:FAD-dependent oxidoreductase n=1 Tax=Gordonia prachuapensis TaxID=3115651 RepID=A0ABU7MUJ4_9ACTN|nr:FAD-dependent oxidoreductase [Gordonia sp. PKS22-38]
MTWTYGTDLRDIVIVGGSVGGMRTAASLRRRGFDGRIRVVAGETTPQYYRPALSKTFLSGDQSEDDVLLPVAEDPELEILLDATATSVDPGSRTVSVDHDGQRLALGYDGLVIATGLEPRRLPLPSLEGIHYVREIADATALRHELDAGPRVVVIGGGLIGAEVAATSRKLGLDVTIVETGDALLGAVLGATVGAAVTDLHRAHGVDVRTGVGVAEVSGARRVESVTLTTGEQIPADVVVVAVGSRPRTDWLAGSGALVDNGVRCAPNLRVLQGESMVAVGDVARIDDPQGLTAVPGSVRIEHWENAVRHSDVAARTLLEGPEAPAYTARTTFWTNQYDLALHVFGHPGRTDELRIAEGSVDELQGVATFHAGDRVTGILTLNQPQRLRAYRHLLDAPEPAAPVSATS